MSYDAANNSFIGFSAPLIKGVPIVNHFQTDSFSDLQRWFHDYDKSTLINVHIVEPLLTSAKDPMHSRPYILAAYGTNNRFNAIDVLRRWYFLYSNCKDQNIRLVGFSTDCDPRYLKAMRLSLGFFARLPNIDLLNSNNPLLEINYPDTWEFFFMRSKQLFLCMQDGVHLATKIRNRLLSTTAKMLIGNQFVSLSHLVDLIDNHPKVDRNLVKSDVIPRDRQNFSSCLKISSDDVLKLLEGTNTNATHIYLYLLKLVILTYVSKSTQARDRLYYGWALTFVCRIWW